jgi:hypothetical protein
VLNSVARVVRCDCGFVNNVVGHTYIVSVVGKCFCCRSYSCQFPYSVIGCS